MEPNAGTNGIVVPDGYWPRLREETRGRGVYLIADEVMSGSGAAASGSPGSATARRAGPNA